MAVAQSLYARMHKDSHTKPLHDATALCGCRCTDAATQTTAKARMRNSACPKFRKDAKPTEQARFDNPAPTHFCSLNEWGDIFGAGAKRWWCDNPSVLTAEKFAI